jgi:hypothetical protein
MSNFEELEDGSKLSDFVFQAAKFDVLCALIQGDHLQKEQIGICTPHIQEAADKIRQLLSEDREEFSVVSCDLDKVWQAFQGLNIPPTDDEMKVVREAMMCVRDTIYFSDDGSVISLGFKFELARLHCMKECLDLIR